MNRSLKFTLLPIAIGVILMVMGVSIVMAQEPPSLFGNQPAECSDPAFLALGEPPDSAALLQVIPTPYGVYMMYVVYSEQLNSVAMLVGHIDLFSALVEDMKWTIEDMKWDAPLEVQEAPSPMEPKTILKWNMIEVTVVLCDGSFKYYFAPIEAETPSPEATPEATATPQS